MKTDQSLHSLTKEQLEAIAAKASEAERARIIDAGFDPDNLPAHNSEDGTPAVAAE